MRSFVARWTTIESNFQKKFNDKPFTITFFKQSRFLWFSRGGLVILLGRVSLTMPNEVFQLHAVARVLEEDVQLAEALGFPEISALDDADRKWRASLQAKARAMLDD